jgi:acyl-coenzyme A synthetase/AMP-(fatty) acid ligase
LKELKNILPDYHAPREVLCLSKFEWTATGKIKRKATLENISQ